MSPVGPAWIAPGAAAWADTPGNTAVSIGITKATDSDPAMRLRFTKPPHSIHILRTSSLLALRTPSVNRS
jgi:hypothetical protein